MSRLSPRQQVRLRYLEAAHMADHLKAIKTSLEKLQAWGLPLHQASAIESALGGLGVSVATLEQEAEKFLDAPLERR